MPRKKKSFTTGNSRGGSVKGVCLSIGSGVWWDCFAEIAWTFKVLTAEITLRQAFCYLALRTPPCGLGWELSFLTERWGSSYTKWSNNLLRITPASWKLTRDGHLRRHGPVEMYTYRIKKIPRAHIRQERETVEIHVDSIFYLIHPKYIISMCGQHITNKKLLMRWFAFFFFGIIFKIWCVFYSQHIQTRHISGAWYSPVAGGYSIGQNGVFWIPCFSALLICSQI